jgi:Lsr2
MVTRTEIILIDDIDGGPAERTVPFALDGQDYETELGAANLAQLEDSLAPFIAAARPVANHGKRKGKRGRTAPGRIVIPPAPAPVDSIDARNRRAKIRAWVKAERPDLEVNERGRVSSKVIAAYNAAHGLGM